MKLLNLDLKAFGPFTNKQLEFGNSGPGLHLVYGPNEAGKSSTLRAVDNLLYGIPERTQDTFLHGPTKLRIGAQLLHSDGSELDVLRRKGRKNVLMTSDETPLEPGALDPFLGGVHRELFRSLFAIDYAELVDGGQSILEGQGNVGHSLFAAGMGTVSVRSVLTNLEDEARRLYKRGGSNPRINSTIRQFREARQGMRDARIKSREWKEQKEIRADSETSREQVEGALTLCLQQRQQAVRAQRLLPQVAALRKAQESLETFRDAVPLPEDFPERRREVLETLRHTDELLNTCRRRLDTVTTEIAELVVPEALLDQATAISDVQERLGSWRKATTVDLPRLRGNHAQQLHEAEDLLRELAIEGGLEDSDPLRCPKALVARVHDLAGTHKAVVDGAAERRRNLRKCKQAAAAMLPCADEPELLEDTSGLKASIAAIAKLGDLESRRDELLRARATAEERVAARIARLPFDGVGTEMSLHQLEQLRLPSSEAVDRFEAALHVIQQRQAGLDQRTEERVSLLSTLEQRLRELELSGQPPNENDLDAARLDRDQRWARVRESWLLGGEPTADNEREGLAGELDDSMRLADGVSDRLRREADRVAQAAGLQAQQERVREEQDTADTLAETLRLNLEDWQLRWTEAWGHACSRPETPREMRVLLREHTELVSEAEQMRKSRCEEEALADQIGKALRRLSKALAGVGLPPADPDEGLVRLLERAQTSLDTLEELRVRRDRRQEDEARLQADLSVAEEELQEAEARLQDWNEGWQSTMASAGLVDTITPGEAVAALEQRRELLGRKEKLDDLERRMFGIERDADRFEEDVQELCRLVAPELEERPATEAATVLNQRLALGQREATRRLELDKQAQALRAEAIDAQARLEQLDRALSDLCKQALCDDVSGLEAVEKQWLQAQQLKREIARMEDALLSQGDGLSLDRILEEIDDVNPDELPGLVANLTHQQEELERERSDLDQRIGAAREALLRMDGSGRGAAGAQDAEALLARMSGDVERYVRLRLAARVLRQEVERYRKQHQGPVLSRASEIFQAITLGGFQGLDTDFDGRDELVLVGLRKSGDRVGVGGLSDGTRDQLYLALRLASIEDWLRRNEPIPLILDDLLVNSDDERAAATFGILNTLSQQTQVLFFTHHQHVVELARQALGAGAMKVHELVA